jgi:phage N-6-adenine-methyltransferase
MADKELAVASQDTDITHYDPEKGLKTRAVAMAAKQHFARLGDFDRLDQAVTAKLIEERDFSFWWDGLGDKKVKSGWHGGKVSTQVDTFLGKYPRLQDYGLTREIVHRWRRLQDANKFQAIEAEQREKARRAAKIEQGPTRGTTGTGENEWYTPTEYLDLVRAVLGEIDLDPASSEQAQTKIKALRYYTRQEDGLTQPWAGRVFLNPPYAQPLIAQFASKMVHEWQKGNIDAAIMLTHNYTDTTWFHEAASCANAIAFTKGRIRFVKADGTLAAPTQGQAFFYYGSDVDLFANVFGAIGFVVAPR